MTRWKITAFQIIRWFLTYQISRLRQYTLQFTWFRVVAFLMDAIHILKWLRELERGDTRRCIEYVLFHRLYPISLENLSALLMCIHDGTELIAPNSHTRFIKSNKYLAPLGHYLFVCLWHKLHTPDCLISTLTNCEQVRSGIRNKVTRSNNSGHLAYV